MTPLSPEERAALLAALAWQIELGADEAIGEHPVDRFAAPDPAPPRAAAPQAGTPSERGGRRPVGTVGLDAPRDRPARAPGPVEATADPAALAAAATDLAALAEAMRGWHGTELHLSARNFVFADGDPRAPLMVVGEAPGADEDRQGKPFVGRAGQLLDRMLAAIGRDRHADDPARGAYIVNILPWRPPGNRTPSAAEAAAFLPFVERHIALAAPEIVLSLGNTPTKALLGTTDGIKRLRGRWTTHAATGRALLPSFHPAYLLRNPADKRLVWADLRAVAARLPTG